MRDAKGWLTWFTEKIGSSNSDPFSSDPSQYPLFEGSRPELTAIAEEYRSREVEISHAIDLALNGQKPQAVAEFVHIFDIETGEADRCYLACRIFQLLSMRDISEAFGRRGLELTPGKPEELVRFEPFVTNVMAEAILTHAMSVEDCRVIASGVKDKLALGDHCSTRALHFEPNDPEVNYWFAHEHFFNLYDSCGDVDWRQYEEEVFRAAHFAESKMPNDSRCSELLFDLYSDCHNYDTAVQWLERALVLKPNSSELQGYRQSMQYLLTDSQGSEPVDN